MTDLIIYEIEVPHDERDPMADIAQAYRVVANEKANAGCVIYGKYRGEWVANVSDRWLVMHLLKERDGLIKDLATTEKSACELEHDSTMYEKHAAELQNELRYRRENDE